MAPQFLTLQQALAHPDQALTPTQLTLMLANIGALDPTVRDQTIYSLFAQQFEQQTLSLDQKNRIARHLTQNHDLFASIDGPQSPLVFLRSFTALLTALVLSDDAQTHWLTPELRDHFFNDALTYLPRETDQRGWTVNGWADGVSHGADLLGAAWAHPAFSIDAVKAALHALTTVLLRQTQVFQFDEEPRLAMTLVMAFQAHHLTTDQLKNWLAMTDQQLWHGFDFDDLSRVARLHNWLSVLHHLMFLIPANAAIQAQITTLSQHYYQVNGYLPR
ncbi:hypothetical protein FD30_GL000603 [Levilactobacillus namurensis DSM 19117]|uniref:DUF2785 domain-containing protein n=1 Tax=Levilactobacillus namurensis DSM 19117 TaxID=1423773 RepID=A0A0R1K928_9LACO|nr:DUF2785 domain-containing protein [Levilactobacillus namurensis]KRK77241.1 hypothetical protein FD30_GL000603 [Levilactobacillus namurensis DSM 19117]GEO73454.1 hypothetical protein LNA02_01520 [Levilactobacillus namurensis]